MDKVALRSTLLQQRLTLSPTAWRIQSDRLCTHLQTCPLFQQARTILAYFSTQQEPDLSPLFIPTEQPSQLLPSISPPNPSQQTIRWGFPRCVGKTLTWYSWQPGEPLAPNRYGILEPLETAPVVPVTEVDLVLVPAIACDRQGYRLGYGGGFYDRLFSNPAWASKPTIGITFAAAYLAQLPIDTWDRPLSAVCTEEGWTVSHQAHTV